MARNIERYGYEPNRGSDTPRTIVLAYHRHAIARLRERAARRTVRLFDGERMPGTPMSDGERIMAYYRQNATARRPLTPRQQRRRKHKDPSLRNL